MDLGSYHPGLFYSEAFAGAPLMSDPLVFGVGRMGGPPDDFQGTARSIAFFHELTHYVHDLALGAALLADGSREWRCGSLVGLLAQHAQTSQVRCPLSDRGLPRAERELIHSARTARADASADAQPPSGSSAASPLALMEGVAAIKTVRALANRARRAENRAHLTRMKEILPILPERLDPVYTSARRMLAERFGLPSEFDDAWPTDYDPSSPRYVLDALYLHAAETALHVPPPVGRLTNPDTLQPSIRFERALEVMHGMDPMEAAKAEGEPDHWHPRFYDAVATRCGWPTHEQTTGLWLGQFHARKRMRCSMADGFRFHLLAVRQRFPDFVILEDAVQVCTRTLTPIVHLTPTGFKFNVGRVAGVYLWQERENIEPFELLQREELPWQDLPEVPDLRSLIEITETEHPVWSRFYGLLREIVIRVFDQELSDAVLTDDGFHCPFAAQGCSAANAGCADLRSLDASPEHGCALRTYLKIRSIEAGNVTWM